MSLKVAKEETTADVLAKKGPFQKPVYDIV